MPTRATRRDWAGLAVVALPCALYAMDLTVLDLALPAISADLRPSNVQLLWIADVYGFFIAGSLITMGTLGDRVGHRRVLLIGAAAFGAASAVAAFATTPAVPVVETQCLRLYLRAIISAVIRRSRPPRPHHRPPPSRPPRRFPFVETQCLRLYLRARRFPPGCSHRRCGRIIFLV